MPPEDEECLWGENLLVASNKHIHLRVSIIITRDHTSYVEFTKRARETHEQGNINTITSHSENMKY